jgi:hypothetical protein
MVVLVTAVDARSPATLSPAVVGRLSRARVREAFLRVQRCKRVDRWAACW